MTEYDNRAVFPVRNRDDLFLDPSRDGPFDNNRIKKVELGGSSTGGFLFVTAMSHFRTQSCFCRNYMTYLNETWHRLPFYHKEENHRRDF